MAAKEEEVRWNGGSDIQILKWKVRKGSMVSKGSVLALYVNAGSTDTTQTVKLKSKSSGLVLQMSAEENTVVHSGDLLLVVHPQTGVTCTHPTIMKDMCADCGADLRNEMGMAGERKKSVTASVAMVHSIPELIVSQELALELGKEDENRLLRERKLVLLVDLDQTLVHTTNDNIPPNLKDVKHFQLWHGKNYMWYHTRFRPFTQRFLETVSKMYELHICTFGVRMYAHIIARLMDPDEKYFSHRILSRDECFDPLSKTANLKALFPCGDKMVGIIDDREDVWNHAPNLVHVKPYRFFQGTADINAPPGLSKCEHDNEPLTHQVVDQSKLKNNKVAVAAGNHKSVSDVSHVPITKEGPDSKKSPDDDGKSSPGKTEATPASVEEEMEVTDDKDDAVACSEDVDDSKDCSLEQSSHSDSANIVGAATSCGDVGNPRDCSPELDSKKGLDNINVVKTETEGKCDILESVVKDGSSDVKDGSSDVKDGSSDVKDSSVVQNPDSSLSVKSTANSGDVIDKKDISEEQAPNQGDLSNTESTVTDPETISEERKDVSSEGIASEASSQAIASEASNQAIASEASSQAIASEASNQAIASEGGGEVKASKAGQPGEQNPAEEIEWADEDDYLLHLEEILTRIHSAYYGMYEQSQHNGSPELPDLKNIIPYVRKKTLKGANVVFSGMFPLNVGLEKSRPYAVAKALGANVHNDIVPQKSKNGSNPEATTHLVASKPGTGKYKTALKTKGINVVNGDWLWSCSERWEWVDERCYPLINKDPLSKSTGSPSDGTPKPHKAGTKKRKTGDQSKEDTGDNIFGDNNNGVEAAGCSKKMKLNRGSEAQPTTSGAQTSEENFANSFNPLYSFSDEDIEFMDKEVDELMDEEGDSSETDEERAARIRQEVLGKAKDSDSDSESLSGDLPRGWKMHRKSLSPSKDNREDEEKETDACDDDETENELIRYQKNMAAFAEDESESASGRDDDSIGSVDDEIADAVEKEFLASL